MLNSSSIGMPAKDLIRDLVEAGQHASSARWRGTSEWGMVREGIPSQSDRLGSQSGKRRSSGRCARSVRTGPTPVRRSVIGDQRGSLRSIVCPIVAFGPHLAIWRPALAVKLKRDDCSFGLSLALALFVYRFFQTLHKTPEPARRMACPAASSARGWVRRLHAHGCRSPPSRRCENADLGAPEH